MEPTLFPIASYDEPHATLIRLAVQAGMPDVTIGGVAPATGGVSAQAILDDHGVGGIHLVYAGVDAGEDWTYTVQLADEAGRTELVVRCPETLFYKVYPSAPLADVVAVLFADLLAHNERFSQWRGRGGEVGYKERLGVPSVKGLPASRGLVGFLERRYREGNTVDAGPAEGWWVETHGKVAQGKQIVAGQGQIKSYRLGPEQEIPERQKPENQPYIRELARCGTVLMWCGGITAVQAIFALLSAAYPIARPDGWTVKIVADTEDWILAGVLVFYFLCAAVSAAMQLLGGNALRSMTGRGLGRAGAIFSMIPGLGPLLVLSLPVGIWALRLLRDRRAERIFT